MDRDQDKAVWRESVKMRRRTIRRGTTVKRDDPEEARIFIKALIDTREN